MVCDSARQTPPANGEFLARHDETALDVSPGTGEPGATADTLTVRIPLEEMAMKRIASFGFVLLLTGVLPAMASELVLPILALKWPGKSGNQWSSELFVTNPGPSIVTISHGRFLPGTLKVDVPCYPPIAAFYEVAPYSTIEVSPQTLYLALQCPSAVLGGMAFDADGPVVMSSRVVNNPGGSLTDGLLAGFGQDVPAFDSGDLAEPGVIYQLPGLVWDPYRCGPPAFETYLYAANPGTAPVAVTLQQSRDGAPGELLVNGADVPTPYTFTVDGGAFRQLKVDLGGAIPATCLPPQLVDLFFTANGGVAMVGSVVDRSSQDVRTVLPVRTSD
jgi:hypothetical protein